LLLPEPTNMDDPWKPEIYAATGLPLFIEAVCNAGASKERLEACVAGGSLVAPLTRRDLVLDIGGRTADVVETILSRERIPIVRSEIGGYFSCDLVLDLQTWETNIDPIGYPTLNLVEASSAVLSPAQLNKAIENLLPIPQVALKILRMIQDDTYNIDDLANEIKLDQVISAKILRLCNSAFFGKRTRISSIDRAMIELGDKEIIQLILPTSVEDFLSQNSNGYSFCKGGLFKHAVGTALISRRLAAITRKASPDLAYTAGLLHDIGKVVLDQYVCLSYPLFYRRIQVDGDELLSVERELFGVDHTNVGDRLAERWSFSETLSDTILYHHVPERATVDSALVHIVYLADLIASRFMTGFELERMNTSSLELGLQMLGLSMGQLPSVIASVWSSTISEASRTGFISLSQG